MKPEQDLMKMKDFNVSSVKKENEKYTEKYLIKLR